MINQKWKLISFVFLGFGLYFAGLFCSFALFLFFLFCLIKAPLLFIYLYLPLALLCIFLSALVVFPQKPEGLQLTPLQASKLFLLIERLRIPLNAKPIDVIYITDELNACAKETGFSFIPGSKKRILRIGLEMLLVLSPKELSAILAHELSHFAAKHSSFGSFAYHMRKRLLNIYLSTEKRRIFKPLHYLMRWYLGKFDLYSAPYLRASEYEADANATKSVAKEDLAGALIRAEIMQKYLDALWEKIWEATHAQEKPPTNPYECLLAQSKQPVCSALIEQTLSLLETQKTTSWNSHPCLKDRLAALQQPLTMPQPIVFSAGEEFFSEEDMCTIRRYFNTRWVNNVRYYWKKRYDKKQKLNQAIMLVETGAELSSDELMDIGSAIFQLNKDPEAAAIYWQKVLQLDPAYAAAHYEYGMYLLTKSDERGIEHLITASQRDNIFQYTALYRIIDFLYEKKREQDAQSYMAAFKEAEAKQMLAKKERYYIQPTDTFISIHELPELEKNYIQEVLSADNNIARTYFVEKKVQYFSENRMYLLALEKKIFRTPSQETIAKLKRIELKDGTMYVFVLGWRQRKLKKILKSIVAC